jgi:molybdopterin/thiamine biosynthesis adenylyltransferase
MLYNIAMHEEIYAAIKESAHKAGESDTPVIDLQAIRLIASQSGATTLQIEIAALESGIIPLCYQRNTGTIGIDGQLKLLRTCVGVCGLGGLGGYVVELLARFGVGHLILADGEVFEESNLNRQTLCTEADLGHSKTESAAARVSAINSSLSVTTHRGFIKAGDVATVFEDAALVIDALDTVSSRLALEEGCMKLGIPLVHGAIAGSSGQAMTILPGDPGLKAIYASGEDRGIETLEGNPPTTAAMVASIQAQEAIKIICGGDLLREGFLLIDLASNIYHFIHLK